MVSQTLLRRFLLRRTLAVACSIVPWFGASVHAAAAEAAAHSASARETIVAAILADDASQRRALITSLAGQGDPAIKELFDAWRQDALFIHAPEGAAPVPVRLVGEKDANEAQAAVSLMTGEPLLAPDGSPLRLISYDLAPVEHDMALRRAMTAVLDLADVGSPHRAVRLAAIEKIGQAQDLEKLPVLRKRLELEQDARVLEELREAIAVTELKSPEVETKLAALAHLREEPTMSSRGFIEATLREADAAQNERVSTAARLALAAVQDHLSFVNFFGTLFRGLSAGSILLVVALGLAITFGLMGVINMAHGEMIAVGAYTTYLVQNVFAAGITLPFFGLSLSLPGIGLSGDAYQSYFLVAIPLSFGAAALVGIALERSIIQFLYRRPLESLLATWGVSLVLQQVFKLMFGANNVQVNSPVYLSGNWTVNEIIFGWNRVFVIGFAIVIVIGVWLLLTRTPLGLLMRAVMQNRAMASCMGVRTSRVNMLTFGLGSGLAGLAGAFLSQIGNVGPTLGQSYIVDSFMVVVVGGVGSIVGTVISAGGIGEIDLFFQQYLEGWTSQLGWMPYIGNFLQNLGQDSAVFGKILVLGMIIVFLQFRPAGLFVTRSRSLEG